jgi:hypothetical protein
MSEAAPSGQLAEKRKPIEVKVYIVCQRRNLAKPGETNVTLLAARLTRAAAQEIVDRNPGTWIEKLVANKSGSR